jgi:hypothetical protein
VETGVGGAGDWERGVLEALFTCRGLAQADFDGGWGGFFGVDAVADLLILIECQRGLEGGGPNWKKINETN